MVGTAVRTVLVVPSQELGWTAVRRTLRAMPSVRLVECATASEAMRCAVDDQPNVAIVASTVAEQPSSGLVRELRQLLPATCNVLIMAAGFAPTELQALASTGTNAYVLWADLSIELLHACLMLMIMGPFLVTSRIVGDTLQDAEATTLGGAPGSTTARQLTARERRLLLDLADGMTQKQIAIAENLSARTVRRQIDRMRMKLDASTLFTLGVNAARLRIVP